MLRKRPYLRREWIADARGGPIARESQPDGRVRFWHRVTMDEKSYILRVVTLEDGETVHNAFFDRNFREAEK